MDVFELGQIECLAEYNMLRVPSHSSVLPEQTPGPCFNDE